MKQKALEEALWLCFADWDGDFDIDIEQESVHGGWGYFAVLVTHKFLAGDFEFTARINDNGDCEMDYAEDCWQDIDKGNMFAWMWFETSQRKSA